MVLHMGPAVLPSCSCRCNGPLPMRQDSMRTQSGGSKATCLSASTARCDGAVAAMLTCAEADSHQSFICSASSCAATAAVGGSKGLGRLCCSGAFKDSSLM
eukprot:GHUV01047823.1.p1 GENE.GHUV01047823.1~~GHUV01047823.1.p1  ORF type:complete len:101 (+),score=25.88 GHUV01047823.1:116-418(+)